MDPTTVNTLMSSQKSSQTHAILHPLVLLTISDYITRHTLRKQTGPIVGALLGQQNGREVTIEHAFECKTMPSSRVTGGYVVDAAHFAGRLSQLVLVHGDRKLDLVGWYTLLPASGPRANVRPIHSQVLRFNDSAILLGFHPEENLSGSVGGKLSLTIYESNLEVDDVNTVRNGEDTEMKDAESRSPKAKLKFREIPYSVETDETEMICMNYVAGVGGNAAISLSREEPKSRSKESTGKGKRRMLFIDEEGSDMQPLSDQLSLTHDEEESLAALNTKANAIRMLQGRIRLLAAYLRHLPPAQSEETVQPSLMILRQLQALVGRLDHVVPSNADAWGQEMLQESNGVHVIDLLNTVMQTITQAQEVSGKSAIVETAKQGAS